MAENNQTSYQLPQAPPSLEISDTELGRGAYGVVYRGTFEGHPVAVKSVHDEIARGKPLQDFLQECQLMNSQLLDHPNIVKCRGAFLDKANKPILVMELLDQNLRDYLDQHRDDVPYERQIEICLAITAALEHLHRRELVHRDANDKNVLVTADGRIKVSDFGQFSKLSYSAEYMHTVAPGNILYMPPEAMDGDAESRYNKKIDVFSVGVLMLQIATQSQPTSGLMKIGSQEERERRKNDLKKLADNHPLKPLIINCLKNDYHQRPTMEGVHARLLKMVDMPDPTGLPQSNDSTPLVAPSMPIPVSHATASVHEGKVFVSGGIGGTEKSKRTVQIYCTQNHSWDTLPPAPMKLSPAAVLEGNLTLLGGIDCSTDNVTNKVVTYIENKREWRADVYPAMQLARHRPGVIQQDNLLVVAGGRVEGKVSDNIEVMNTDAKQWFTIALKLPVPMWIPNMTICNNYVYLCGKDQSNNSPTSESWKVPWNRFNSVSGYNTEVGVTPWQSIAKMPVVLPCIPYCSGMTDQVIIVGGRNIEHTPIRDIHRYDSNRDEWLPIGALSVARLRMCTALISNDTIFVAGGYTDPENWKEKIDVVEFATLNEM